MSDAAEAMADYLKAIEEHMRLAREIRSNVSNFELVETLSEQQAQQLTIIRCNAAVLMKGESNAGPDSTATDSDD
jgi:hypothetical protein